MINNLSAKNRMKHLAKSRLLIALIVIALIVSGILIMWRTFRAEPPAQSSSSMIPLPTESVSAESNQIGTLDNLSAETSQGCFIVPVTRTLILSSYGSTCSDAVWLNSSGKLFSIMSGSLGASLSPHDEDYCYIERGFLQVELPEDMRSSDIFITFVPCAYTFQMQAMQVAFHSGTWTDSLSLTTTVETSPTLWSQWDTKVGEYLTDPPEVLKSCSMNDRVRVPIGTWDGVNTLRIMIRDDHDTENMWTEHGKRFFGAVSDSGIKVEVCQQ